MVSSLDDLSEEDLIKILTQPKNAIIKQYANLLELDGVRVSFQEDALQAIAAEAIKRNTGARGLRAILEDSMLNIMFDIPSEENIEELILTREVIEKQTDPVIIYKKDKAS